ncbi:uncharacterized protein LOC118204078 [Stegodyphus dumicola]|uniref:uncharacterized protein LOC118204078 n=1 Tax=Stegodyphus dumicola TaxID=202533 RepID=UPI0015B188F4|nr:uncharacterized protein LOC118204078 [Stegodyphus dumicola]
MKGVLLSVTLSVALAVSHALAAAPLARSYSPGLTRGISSYSSPRLGISGRPDYRETIYQESGNIYGGQRGGRFLQRGAGGSVRGLQYSASPAADWSATQGPVRNVYQQQGISGYQDGGLRSAGYGYARQRQVSFTAPLANTRSYNPQLDVARNQPNEYGYY